MVERILLHQLTTQATKRDYLSLKRGARVTSSRLLLVSCSSYIFLIDIYATIFLKCECLLCSPTGSRSISQCAGVASTTIVTAVSWGFLKQFLWFLLSSDCPLLPQSS